MRADILEYEAHALDTAIEDAEFDSFIALTITASSGRRQTVMISYMEAETGPDWFRVESVFGPYHPQIALAGIDYVAEPENGAVGVARIGDHLMLRWTGTIGMTTSFHALTMIDGVAGMADRLEEILSQGRDSF